MNGRAKVSAHGRPMIRVWSARSASRFRAPPQSQLCSRTLLKTELAFATCPPLARSCCWQSRAPAVSLAPMAGRWAPLQWDVSAMAATMVPAAVEYQAAPARSPIRPAAVPKTAAAIARRVQTTRITANRATAPAQATVPLSGITPVCRSMPPAIASVMFSISARLPVR